MAFVPEVVCGLRLQSSRKRPSISSRLPRRTKDVTLRCARAVDRREEPSGFTGVVGTEVWVLTVKRVSLSAGSEARTHRICLEGRPFAINGYPLGYT